MRSFSRRSPPKFPSSNFLTRQELIRHRYHSWQVLYKPHDRPFLSGFFEDLKSGHHRHCRSITAWPYASIRTDTIGWKCSERRHMERNPNRTQNCTRMRVMVHSCKRWRRSHHNLVKRKSSLENGTKKTISTSIPLQDTPLRKHLRKYQNAAIHGFFSCGEKIYGVFPRLTTSRLPDLTVTSSPCPCLRVNARCNRSRYRASVGRG